MTEPEHQRERENALAPPLIESWWGKVRRLFLPDEVMRDTV